MERQDTTRTSPERPRKPHGWRVFLHATLILLGLLVLGPLTGVSLLLDPVAVFLYACVCGWLIVKTSRLPRSLSVLGLVALVAVVASLIFVLTKDYVGFGDSFALTLDVTVRDADSNRAIEGARVVAWVVPRRSTDGETDWDGHCQIQTERWTSVSYSWFYSRCHFTNVTVEVTADSYVPDRRELTRPSVCRYHLFEKPVSTRPPPPEAIGLVFALHKRR